VQKAQLRLKVQFKLRELDIYKFIREKVFSSQIQYFSIESQVVGILTDKEFSNEIKLPKRKSHFLLTLEFRSPSWSCG